MVEQESEEQKINVISHLFEVEKEAETLVCDAEAEAAKRIAAAKESADDEYRKEHDKVVSDLKADYDLRIAEINRAKDEEMASYKEKIEKQEKNTKRFNAFLDSVFFPSQS